MDLPHYFPDSLNFSSFKNYFEQELSREDDIASIFGYGIVNGVLQDPPGKSRENTSMTDMLSSYSRMKHIATLTQEKGIESTLEQEDEFLSKLLKKYISQEREVSGLAQRFLLGKHNLLEKKNPSEYLRTFGTRIFHGVHKVSPYTTQKQNRISDYNIIKKVLRELN